MSSPLFLSVSRSHLQPIFPEAPAPQHSAVLAGSHHRPGRCGSLLFLDVEASQAGVPGSPRSHTRKSNSGLHFWLLQVEEPGGTLALSATFRRVSGFGVGAVCSPGVQTEPACVFTWLQQGHQGPNFDK